MDHSPMPMSASTGSPEVETQSSPPCRDSGHALTPMRLGEKGAGSLKAIIWTVILVILIYVGFQVVPLLVSEYQFQDGIQTIARMASVNRPAVEKIRKSVLEEAQKDELPIASEDIKVESVGGNIRISADYSVVVDLKVYQWTLNFHPTASNNALF
jgi:hypothetical protein